MENVHWFLLGSLISGLGITLIFFLKISSQKKLLQEKEILLGTKQQEAESLNLLNKEISDKLETERQISEDRAIVIATLESEINHLNKTVTRKEGQLENLQKRLTTEFENIANRILQQKNEEIALNQTKNLNNILNPLKENLLHFEQKIEATYDKELRDKINLREEVKKLYQLNHRISEEANNLTRALKGDVKKMGNWGELILERVLEQSGLTMGREYQREMTITNEAGDKIRPDVIISLPDQKHLIIDSKLSLLAYERFNTATHIEAQNQALKEHLISMRNHIKGLHVKNYASAPSLNTPDFVLMFIPIEASFATAVEADSDLFAFAWEKKIVPVSPSTLLATLRTISSIWKQENQNKNALEIARQSGALYDKFVGFLTDMEKIGKGITNLQGNYEEVIKKLKTGKGNLISKSESIRKLGAKNSKVINETIWKKES